jgi:NTE family protein
MDKTALVLSGGGLFGAYQSGAWLRLSQSVSIDLVAATSVGALNGWWIASKSSAQHLTERWLDPSAAALTALRPSWRGLLDWEALEDAVRRLTAAMSPVMPFGVTMVEFPRLRQRLVCSPEVTWRHLVAACSMPGGYPPRKIDGRWWVDGGVLDALPVWAAAEMGATRAIAINVLAVPPSKFLRGAARAVRALASKRPSAPGVEVLHISPPQALGTVRDTQTWRPDLIRRWIDQGFEDAARALKNAPGHWNVC